MSVRESVRQSLQLLPSRDRRMLGVAAVAQISTNLLDLAGVLAIGLVAAMSVSATTGVPIPPVVASVLDRFGLQDTDLFKLSVVLIASAGTLLVVKSVLGIVLTRRVMRFLANRQAVMSGRLVDELLSRSILQIQSRTSQETAYALTSGANVATMNILGPAVTSLTEVSLLIILGLGLLVLDPVVTAFAALFFLIIALLLQQLMSVRAEKLGLVGANAEVASVATIQEALGAYREVAVTNRRFLYAERFRSLRWQAASVQSDMNFMGMIPKYVFEVGLVVGGGLLAVSQFVLKDAAAAVATIAVFLAAGSRIVPSMLRFQAAALAIRSAGGLAEPTFRLARELDISGTTSHGNSFRTGPTALQLARYVESGYVDFTPEVVVDRVTAVYPGSASPATQDVSFVVPAGTSLAVAGPTGAGKSTLTDLVLGILEPQSGTVTVGGLRPADAVTRWPGALAYVPQDVAMSEGTIRDNVALGMPHDEIDDERVWEALERAHLATFLRESRDGLLTHVGERGVRLSGGQRQRLGIARALYTRPLLLVLDEATSALDAGTEHNVVDTIREMEGDVTTITIAHRLATIRHCDQVVYLEKGRMIARGTFEEVRASAQRFDEQARLLGL